MDRHTADLRDRALVYPELDPKTVVARSCR